MPSKPPRFWQDDVVARERLAKGKFLSVSVGRYPGWTIQLTTWRRIMPGAPDGQQRRGRVEANFSCPNVSSVDGQLYLNAADAGLVARGCVRRSDKPLLLKVGHFAERDNAQAFFEAVAPQVDALVMVNGVSTRVRDECGELLFEGRCRGSAAKLFAGWSSSSWPGSRSLSARAAAVRLVGVGGLGQAADVVQALGQG